MALNSPSLVDRLQNVDRTTCLCCRGIFDVCRPVSQKDPGFISPPEGLDTELTALTLKEK